MSYILAALALAERERLRRLPVARSQMFPAGPQAAAPPGRPRLWPLPAALAAGALFALLPTLAWRAPPAEPLPALAAVPAPAGPIPAVLAVPPPEIRPAGVARVKRARRAAAGRPAKAAARPAGPRLYQLGELPGALQRTAKGLAVAGYAHAGERLAIVNDRAVREGEWLASGLRVERIGGDGVVFNLKGYRFLKGRS